MSSIRSRAKAFLSNKRVTIDGSFVASRIYKAREDTARKVDLWWFDLPLKKVKKNADSFYYLLCETENNKFLIFKVPNKFLLEHLRDFETRYKDCIRLHIDENNIDQRGSGKINFERFLKID